MKKLILILALFSSFNSFAQILLQDKQGDPLFLPFIPAGRASGLIKLNTGDQSIGFDYFKSNQSQSTNRYTIKEIGIKAKPTEGYAAVFSTGQFSPGISMRASLTQVKILDRDATKPENYFLDWGTVYIGYSINKYQLYKFDTLYTSQFSSVRFKGMELGVNYNILFKSEFLLSLKASYSRRNNYNDLTNIEVKEVRTIVDSTSNTTRQVSSTRSGREGNYSEFDTFPISVSLTKLTPDNNPKNIDIGYSVYLNSLVSREKPKTNAGLILFLTQTKKGISTPVIGLDFGVIDPFDVERVNNGMFERLNVSIISNIPLF